MISSSGVRPDFPIAIDSSMRAAFAACPRKFYWNYMRHLRLKGESTHLIAGGAFARGAEVIRRSFWEQGLGLDASLAAGVVAATAAYGDHEPALRGSAANKTLERVIEGLVWYFHRYPPFTDTCQPLELAPGKRAIEFKFSFPLPINHPVTNEPILYCGRSDMIVTYKDSLLVFDDKTTSQLGASWPDSWRLRAQLDGYIWAAAQGGYGVSGAIVRGISFLRNGYDTAESLQLHSGWQLDRWYDQLVHDIRRMISCWENGWWDYNLDSACASYGSCPFVSLCTVEDPEPWIEGYYEIDPWSPLDIAKE